VGDIITVGLKQARKPRTSLTFGLTLALYESSGMIAVRMKV
jgi:hypothetical protein